MGLQNASNDDMICRILHDKMPQIILRFIINHVIFYNWFISQLGTSCAFDSPGLARNEPTPGEHPQGDSTP